MTQKIFKYTAIIKIDKKNLKQYIAGLDPANKAALTKLLKLYSMVENREGLQPIVEFHLEQSKFGRFSKSAQDIFNILSLEKVLRKIILIPCFEVDMISSHPTILLFLLNEINIDNDFLSKYINDKEDLARHLGVNVAELKRCVLSTLNVECLSMFKVNSKLESHIKNLHENIMELHDRLIQENNTHYVYHQKTVCSKNLKKNIKGKIMARFLQDFESQILIYMLNELSEYPFKIPLHDGVLIQNKKELGYEELKLLETKIFSKFGIPMGLAIKESMIPDGEFDLGFSDPVDSIPVKEDNLGGIDAEISSIKSSKEDIIEVNENGEAVFTNGIAPFKFVPRISPTGEADTAVIVVDDMKSFVTTSYKSLEPFVVKDINSLVWVKIKGVWINDPKITSEHVFRFLINSGLILEKDGKTTTFFDMFGILKNFTKNLYIYIKPTDIHMFHKIQKDSLGLVMFRCGAVYSIDLKKEVSGANLFFGAKLSFDYADFLKIADSDVLEAKIFLLSFFRDEYDLLYFLKYISSSIHGINSFWKNSLLIIGPRSSGKSLLIKMLSNTFTVLIKHDMDSSHISINKNTADSARQWNFAKNFYYQRLATCSEFGGNTLNETVIKKIQGRDSIYCRGLYEEETQVPIGISLIMVNNDVIDCKDPAIYDKITILETPFEFVVNPNGSEQQKQVIDDLEEKIKSKNFCLSFMKLIFGLNPMVKPTITKNMLALKTTVIDTLVKVSVEQWFNSTFNIGEDFRESTTDILESASGLKFKAYEIHRFFKNKNFKEIRFKKNNIRVRGYSGFKIKDT